MKKLFGVLLSFLFVFSIFTIPTMAQEDVPSFVFELSVDGSDTKEVNTGDIITVTLKLQRTDSSKQYTMYAMQDEIRYNSEFFEMVEGSTVLSSGIVSTDIALVDQYREFYMNYLSMSGGAQWDADILIGSFQLRVIAESGVTKITNQDYLVSLQDGSGSYDCEANEVTIVLSTDCTVRFDTNGGNEIEDQIVQYGEVVIRPVDPVREGYVFEGWYKDIHLSEEWDFEQDVVQGNMSLYAKWSPGITTEEQPNSESECWLWLLVIMVILVMLYTINKTRKKNKAKGQS